MKRSIEKPKLSSPTAVSLVSPEGQDRAGEQIRVLVADDHPTVLAGMSSIIGMQPDMVVVAEAENGRQAVDLWHKHRPEVTLLDLRMPVLDGVGVINEICQQEASAKFIILTTYDTDNEIYGAIKAGQKATCSKTNAVTFYSTASAK